MYRVSEDVAARDALALSSFQTLPLVFYKRKISHMHLYRGRVGPVSEDDKLSPEDICPPGRLVQGQAVPPDNLS